LYIHPPAPCFVKLNAAYFRHDVNHHWGRANAKEVIRLGEVLWAQAFDWCSELSERRIYAFAVFSVGANQNVQIFGRSRLSVIRDSVSADNQVSNFSGVEGGQQFFEVSVHQLNVLSAHKGQG
jgi:hypothetical protein